MLCWEGRTRVPFCGTLLRAVKDGLKGICGGTCGLSAVFSKFNSSHLFRWRVHGSRPPPPHSPVAVLPVFTPMIRMQIIAKFLGALSPPRTVASCTAQDIVKFVISKDKWGRTLAHSLSCSKRDCSCQKRLAAGSVDSTLGHLRAIFNNLGALMTPTLLPKP